MTHRRFQDVTYSLLYGVRLLRNAASHHNCLLIPSQEDIKRTEDLDKLLKVFLPDGKESAKTLKLAETDPLIHDFACVLIAHINLVQSIGMRSGVVKQIELLSSVCGVTTIGITTRKASMTILPSSLIP